ncbi:carboxypeptidase D isoform X2 [Nilaparvata lugens]|uniref:carboxypeptidase D isoform X2 n=1 Tax=Nilaparvata lugens TaxID=108931 RepID=UPI00193D8ED2|nr:carboxypeptidase D isoform X2 [Nilaparvata lugens]
MLDFNGNLAVICLLLLVFIISTVNSQVNSVEFVSLYHNKSHLDVTLHSLANEHPDKARLYSIGTSRRDTDLWVLELNGNLAELNSANGVLGVPHVKLIGNIHGNEPVGREMILRLAKHLLENYTTDSEVKWLMDNTRISLLPCLNPDGFEIAEEKEELDDCRHDTYVGSGNGIGVDLNKNFPDYFRKNQFRDEPETEALKQWMYTNNFVLSGSLQDGALKITYPFNSLESFNEWQLERKNTRNPTPDDDVFEALAQLYAKENPKINEPCFNQKGGVINGAADQHSVGTMADYNYHAHGCMELTLKISCCIYPPSDQLEILWNENKEALMKFMAQSHRGVRGVVRNEDGQPIEFAKVVVRGREFPTNTTKRGEFWKVLTRAGLYTLRITADGYETIDRHPFVVPHVQNISRPNYIWLDITMKQSKTGDPQENTEKVPSYKPPADEDNGVELLNWPAKNRRPENLAADSDGQTTESSQFEELNTGASTSQQTNWDLLTNNYAIIMIVFGLIALILVVALICTEQFSARSFK